MLRVTSESRVAACYLRAERCCLLLQNRALLLVFVYVRFRLLSSSSEKEIPPSVRRGLDVIRVVIAENDNARGVIQFNVPLVRESIHICVIL